MSKRAWLLGLMTLGLAGLFTFFKIPVASSQGLTISATRLDGELPVGDPTSDLWQQATPVQVPLSAQNIAKPYLTGVGDRNLTVRALQNDEELALLVAWEDQTQNDQAVRVQDFRDAVAVQFPLTSGEPFFCMGQQGGNVNIWHWKADWQTELSAWQDVDTIYPDMYVDTYAFVSIAGDPKTVLPLQYDDPNYLPALAAENLLAAPDRGTAVEDIIAGGFGGLTSQAPEGQNVAGAGVWEDGRWRVVVSRTLSSDEAEDVQLLPGRVHPVAFAVWDGANQERNGQKSTSQWVSLRLQPRPGQVQEPAAEAAQAPGTAYLIFWILVGFVTLLVIAGAVIYFRLPN